MPKEMGEIKHKFMKKKNKNRHRPRSLNFRIQKYFGVTIPPALLSRIQTQRLQVPENSKQSQRSIKSPKKKISHNHNKTKKDSRFVSGKK